MGTVGREILRPTSHQRKPPALHHRRFHIFHMRIFFCVLRIRQAVHTIRHVVLLERLRQQLPQRFSVQKSGSGLPVIPIQRERTVWIGFQTFHYQHFRLNRVAVNIRADSQKSEPGIDFLCEIALLVDAPDMQVPIRVRGAIAPVDESHELVQRIPLRFDQ